MSHRNAMIVMTHYRLITIKLKIPAIAQIPFNLVQIVFHMFDPVDQPFSLRFIISQVVAFMKPVSLIANGHGVWLLHIIFLFIFACWHALEGISFPLSYMKFLL